MGTGGEFWFSPPRLYTAKGDPGILKFLNLPRHGDGARKEIADEAVNVLLEQKNAAAAGRHRRS
jgi:hypothetical protein